MGRVHGDADYLPGVGCPPARRRRLAAVPATLIAGKHEMVTTRPTPSKAMSPTEAADLALLGVCSTSVASLRRRIAMKFSHGTAPRRDPSRRQARATDVREAIRGARRGGTRRRRAHTLPLHRGGPELVGGRPQGAASEDEQVRTATLLDALPCIVTNERSPRADASTRSVPRQCMERRESWSTIWTELTRPPCGAAMPPTPQRRYMPPSRRASIPEARRSPITRIGGRATGAVRGRQRTGRREASRPYGRDAQGAPSSGRVDGHAARECDSLAKARTRQTGSLHGDHRRGERSGGAVRPNAPEPASPPWGLTTAVNVDAGGRSLQSPTARIPNPDGAADAMHGQADALRLLLVDDDPAIIRAYGSSLARHGATVETASNGREATERVKAGRVRRDRERHLDARDDGHRVPQGRPRPRPRRPRDPDDRASPALESAVRAVEYGAFRYLAKPVASEELWETVIRARELHKMAKLKREALELPGRDGRRLGERAALEVRFSWGMKPHVDGFPAHRRMGRTARLRLRGPASLGRAADEEPRRHARRGRAARAPPRARPSRSRHGGGGGRERLPAAESSCS